MIEPYDVNNYGLRKRIFGSLKFLLKFLLRKEIHGYGYNFEKVGNFVYSTNERELEKFLLGMHYRNIAFKSISDIYIEGGENISLKSKNIKDRMKILIFKIIVFVKEIINKLGFENNSLLCSILFKDDPDEDLILELKKYNWKFKKLPKNTIT